MRWLTLSGFKILIGDLSQGCRWRSNPGLEVANAFGVQPGLELANAFGVQSGLEVANAFGVFQLNHYQIMERVAFKQSSHLEPSLTDPATRTLNVEGLLGTWKNTNPKTLGLSEIIIAREGSRFFVSPIGVGDEGPIHWPKTEGVVLANLEEEAGQKAVAIAANFDLGFMTADTHLRVNKGVLVIVLIVTFRDDSGRSDYINREFFYREVND